jgi:hypothetical protein
MDGKAPAPGYFGSSFLDRKRVRNYAGALFSVKEGDVQRASALEFAIVGE